GGGNVLDETIAGERRVGDRRAVGELALRAEARAVALYRAGRRRYAPRADRGLKRVARHDLPDVDENRRVGITQPHDVEQRLSLPRVADGRAVVESVAWNRRGPDGVAAREPEYGRGCQQTPRRADCDRSVHIRRLPCSPSFSFVRISRSTESGGAG